MSISSNNRSGFGRCYSTRKRPSRRLFNSAWVITKVRRDFGQDPYESPILRFLTILRSIAGVTNNVITSQVASGLVAGLFPDHSTSFTPVLVQPPIHDSLEPRYPCRKASSIRKAITSGKQWTEHLSRASSVYDKLDKVSGIPTNDHAGWHDSFDR